MSPTSDLPLHIYQVLEEEYSYQYGFLPGQTQIIYLPDRRGINPSADPQLAAPAEQGESGSSPGWSQPPTGFWRCVAAQRNWLFLRGHVKDPALFAAQIIPHEDGPDYARIPPDLKQLLPSFDMARENLKRHIYHQIDRGLIQELLTLPAEEGGRGEVLPELERRLEAELNRLLKDEGLYHPDRFAPRWLSPASRALIGQRERHGQFRGGGNADDDKLDHGLAHFNRLLLEDAFPALEKIQGIRLAAIRQRLHERRPTALCLSGGDLRSSTFALGLLQGLARHDLLKEFDYLSTVSGGSYIGSWLTAWLHRHPEGIEGVTRDLAGGHSAGGSDQEPEPVTRLRESSGSMTPKLRLLASDTWTSISMYLRNLLLNWAVIVPLMLAALLLPRLLVALTLAQPEEPEGLFRIPSTGFVFQGRHLFFFFGFLLGVWALAYINFNRPGLRRVLWEKSRFWRYRSDQKSFVKYCLVPLVSSAMLLTTYFAWSQEFALADKGWGTFLVFGLIFGLCSFAISSVVLRRWRHTIARHGRHGSALPYALAQMLAGVAGSLLFWVIAWFNNFTKPVIGYRASGPGAPAFDYLSWPGASSWRTEIYVCAAVPLFLLVVWGATTAFVGLSSTREAITDEDREWWARFGAWLLVGSIVWAAFTTIVIFGPVVLLTYPAVLGPVTSFAGLLALLLTRAPGLLGLKFDDVEAGKFTEKLKKLPSRLAIIFLAAILAILSLGTSYLIRGIVQIPNLVNLDPRSGTASCDRRAEWLNNVPCDENSVPLSADGRVIRPVPLRGYAHYLAYLSPPYPQPPAPPPGSRPDDEKKESFSPDLVQGKLIHMNVVHHTSLWFLLLLFLALVVVGALLSRIINFNIFAINAGYQYRNKLIQVFLGPSRPWHVRSPDPFTGFDPEDNVSMHALRPSLLDDDDLLDAPGLKARLLGGEPTEAHARLAARLSPLLSRTAAAPDSDTAELRDALRTDLNRVLIELSLYVEFEPQFTDTRRARGIVDRVKRALGTDRLGRDTVRADYHILLNRLVLEGAYENLIKPAPYPPPPYKLLHIVNASVRLGGDNPAPHGRSSEPFSISPLHAGSLRLGYRASRDYGGRDMGGISLGTAAAISAIGAGSDTGYQPSSAVSLLLTLFSITRRGWWLGNPGAAGHDTYRASAPRNSVMPLVSQTLGTTDDRNEYVYLTDGGHFENLALYEMVLRRCRVIVCSDCSRDENYNFDDLGNAVEKIRTDLGIPIEFTSVPIYAEEPEPKEGKGRGFYWAVGRIRYSASEAGAPDGVLIYIKPAVYGSEPRDVITYKRKHPAFPHEVMTGGQHFDARQFESYRALGSHVMDQLCGEEPRRLDLYDLVKRAERSLAESVPGH
ncbi:MAG TPA: hypothetical protein VK421_08335 [Pyrinomonadaceae bacterium]|nr:hypothetical protein [Pyrinomonadaceae bacterium]